MLQTWETEEGLPDNAINDLVQTPDGHLWLATLSGLVRFDGARFSVFTPANTAGLHSAQIRGLHVDGAGTLWIAAGQGGVSFLRTGQFGTMTRGLAPNIFQSFGEDGAGALWLSAWATPLLHRLNRETITVVARADGTDGNKSSQWAADRNGALWLASDDTLHAARDGTFAPEWQSPEGSLRIAPRAAGGLWLATDGRLRVWENGGVASEAALPAHGPVRALLEDRGGAIWLGNAERGLHRWLGGSATRVETSHASIRALFEDREGNIWAGTEGGGLNLVRTSRFTIADRADRLPSDVVVSLCEDRDGALWCVTQGGGVSVRPRSATEFVPLGDLAPPSAISICATPDGSVWIGTDGEGIVQIRGAMTRRFRASDGLASDFVPILFADRASRIWAGTPFGISRFEGEAWRVIVDARALAGGARCIAEDTAGTVWAGAGDGRLHRFAGETHESFGPEHGLPGAVIRCLLATDDGALLLGTDGGGLCRWQDGKATRFTSRDGLTEDVITQLQRDDSGRLWCGSPRGLFRIDEDHLAADARIHATFFGRSDGLPNFRFASEHHPRSWRAQDGRLLFATQKGIVIADPRRFVPNPLPPPVVIQELRVDGRALWSSPGGTEAAPPALPLAARIPRRRQRPARPAPTEELSAVVR